MEEEPQGQLLPAARGRLHQPEGTHPELRYQGKNRDRVPVHRVVEVDAKKYTFTVVNDQEANTFAASLVERMWLDHLPVNLALGTLRL